MRWLGKYGWLQDRGRQHRRRRSLFFLMFEVWFKVPLPKGPLEALASGSEPPQAASTDRMEEHRATCSTASRVALTLDEPRC